MEGWFEVDKAGLGKILRRRGIEFVLWELVSNAWDSDAPWVAVRIHREPGERTVTIEVEDDDPNGFRDVSHAYTMFADSCRRGDPSKRGRFNLGEKLVLAVAVEATIATTTSAIRFDAGGRHHLRAKRARGSCVTVVVPMTREEQEQVEQKFAMLLPPIPTKLTTDQGNRDLDVQVPDAAFYAALDTVLPDEEGGLRHVRRETEVEIYRAGGQEGAWLYELGIPVVPLDGDAYSYNVKQKVPLSMERDNVPPSYLRALRVFAFNRMHESATAEDCNATWVRDALTDDRVEPEAVRTAVEKRFGEKVVAYDPSDREANSRATAEGYVVVHGSQLSAREWDSVRRAEAILPAGRVTPSPKAYSASGREQNVVPMSEWTEGMHRAAQFAGEFARRTIGTDVRVRWVAEDQTWPFRATFGPGGPLVLNRSAIPRREYEDGITEAFVELLVHEFGHQFCGDHLSDEYHRGLCRIGARVWSWLRT
jgi:hypothetical protein